MEHLPIFLRIRERPAVVVGGGAVAARKVELLLRCGADITVVAPELHKSMSELLAMVARRRLKHIPAAFEPAHLDGAAVVIAATDSEAVNAEVATVAGARNIPVNVVDDSERSTFILPAIVDRSPVIVAIGSGGSSPVLARGLRAQLEALLPARLGALARFAGLRREKVQRTLRPSQRRRFWERILSGPIAARVLGGEEREADDAFTRELSTFSKNTATGVGEVYLIGAGPGDPDLLTLKALQLLQQADVILYDRLVSPAVLERARREAERVFVGKEAHGHHLTQQRIHDLLVDYARRGLRVARLKGGDPFIFGRGGEEIEVLAKNGIPFTIVPGITAGLGAAAATGIPLTHRELSQAVTFTTGHLAQNDSLDWQSLARPRHTVVFYMGVSQLEHITERLRAAGAPADRPAAVIERATLADQRVIRGTLADIVPLAREAKVAAPALLVIGDVVSAVQSGTGAVINSIADTLKAIDLRDVA
jgi:uroporphyrin-III C-methyltransferase/precorrin-2 dehydrogenase/sirohydrochlorin ferrochelatase